MSLEEKLRERFLLQGIASGPATTEQIDGLEARLGHQLPAAYRAYLRVCGTHPPRALVGSDCVLGDVLDNNEAAIELLAENGIDRPEEPFVVFLMHQGYHLDYFLIDGSDDPPVYSYTEGDEDVTLSDPKFSYWVTGIPGHIAT